MRNKQSIKLFLILIICSTYIFSFSQLGAFAYDTFFHKFGSFEKGTMLGSVDLSRQSKQEASTLLNEKWTNWQNETTITFHYKEKTEAFDNALFTFLHEESFSRIKQGQRNELVIKLESLEAFLTFISPTLTHNILDIKKLKMDLLAKAGLLETGNIDMYLENYLLDPSQEQNNTVEEVVLETNLSFNEKNIMNEQLHEMVLAPKTQFSLIKHVQELGLQNLSSEALSSIATGIYQVILPTNFSIIERNISEELPAYAELGFEAKVNVETNKDLVFLNGNESNYKIILKAEDDRLVVSLKGPSFLQQYKIITQDQQSFEPKTIVQFNNELSSAQKVVEKEGKEGQSIKVVRKIYSENNGLIQKESISEDFYPPVHQVEVHGLIVSKSTNEVTNASETTNAATAGTTDTTNADESNANNKTISEDSTE